MSCLDGDIGIDDCGLVIRDCKAETRKLDIGVWQTSWQRA